MCQHVNYAYIMASRPQALAGLADSPEGLAVFRLHDARSLEMISRAFAGEAEGLTRDDFLDNVTRFWLTNTVVSAGRLYAENKALFLGIKGVTLPVAVRVFPDEIYQPPSRWTEQAYPNLVHYNKLPRGGTSPPGNSRSYSWASCARASASSGREVSCREVVARFPGLRWSQRSTLRAAIRLR